MGHMGKKLQKGESCIFLENNDTFSGK